MADELVGGSRTGKPVILAVCDDAEDLAKIERELRTRYEADYQVACESFADSGLRKLRDFKAAGEDVALVLADQRMAGLSGVEVLARVREVYPVAKRLLLFGPMDRSTGALLPQAMALGWIDYFDFKPGPPPNERFHQIIADFLEEWSRPHRSEMHAMVRVVGERWSARSHEVRDLFERYRLPYAFYSVDSEEGRALLGQVGQSPRRLPVLVLLDGQVLVDPSNEEVADAFVGTDVRTSGAST